MSTNLLTPKYVTKEIAESAVDLVLGAVMNEGSSFRPRLNGSECHIVVLVPAMKDDRATDYHEWPNYPLQPVALYEHSVGDPGMWATRCRFDDIARCKALQLWTDRNDDRPNVVPHLLFPGDTIYWGGVKRSGIVVACSGFQPWFDRMISGMVADMIIALAHSAYQRNHVENKGPDFI